MFSLIWALNKRLSKQSWGWWFETPSHYQNSTKQRATRMHDFEVRFFFNHQIILQSKTLLLGKDLAALLLLNVSEMQQRLTCPNWDISCTHSKIRVKWTNPQFIWYIGHVRKGWNFRHEIYSTFICRWIQYLLLKLLNRSSDEYQRTSPMIRQNWFRQWLGAVR